MCGMDFRKQRLSIKEGKEIDMVNYLSSLGYKPVKIRNSDYWYLSPLREEKTASFKINRKLNRWYDHGLGKGGNLIDFGIEYYSCSINELLDNLSVSFSFQQPISHLEKVKNKPPHKIKVLGDFSLKSYSLLRYLKQRLIPIDVADNYCREIRYKLDMKTYYGIGFKNNSGGFEICNPYFKASSFPKDITTIKNGSNKAVVFEGCIDFLSFKAIHKNFPENSQDFVILNSVSFFEKARPFMEAHRAIHLYLDWDVTGLNVTKRALSMSSKYLDESNLYKNLKDLNDWMIVNFGKSS